MDTQPAQREVHVILDNFSTHRTDLVKRYLEQNPNVTLHFTLTYSSWLNQVESWFSKLQRDVIDRGIFTFASSEKSVGNRVRSKGLPEARLAQPANPMWDSAALAFCCS